MSESLISRTRHFEYNSPTGLVSNMASYIAELGDKFQSTGPIYMSGAGRWFGSVLRKSSLPKCPCAYDGFCGCICEGHECHRGMPNESACAA